MKKLTPQALLGYGVWVVSFVVATLISLFMVYVWLDTDIQTYTVKYFLATVIPIAVLFAIWLDYLLGTKMLPE